MPGMMGGMGGMMGGMFGGGGGRGMGMGGPGMGGMGGQSGMGGSGGDMNGAGSYEMFDVDRWKRADEDYRTDDTSTSFISPAQKELNNRLANRNKTLDKIIKKSKLLTKIDEKHQKRLLKKLEGYNPSAPIYPAHRTESSSYANRGSEHVRPRSETRIQEKRKNEEKEKEKNAPVTALEKGVLDQDKKVAMSSFHQFFTSNPVNSVILGSDCLSTGPLTLNQIVKAAPDRPDQWTHDARTDYMNEIKKNKPDKRYQARIINDE